MPVDQARYDSLIARAAFNMEAFRGTWQDLSSAKRVMTAVGAPTWSRVNGLPCLSQRANADGTTSGNIASVLDITGTFTLEAVVRVNLRGKYQDIAGQFGVGGGGWEWYFHTNNTLILLLSTAAGVGARVLSLAAAVLPTRSPFHLLFTSSAGGTAGTAKVNGVPVAVTLALAGVAANPVARPYVTLGQLANPGDADRTDLLLHRAWQGALTNEDATALYQQAHILTGGEV